MKYRIEIGASTFTVKAFAGGVLAVLAHHPTFAVRQYEGEVSIDPESGTGASLRLTILASSLELIDKVKSRDRDEIERIMREQVLQTARYPSIVYDSPASTTSARRTGVGQFNVVMEGDLTLHGATRRQPVHARAVVNGGVLRASGQFRVRQTEYGIRLVTAAVGAIAVKDEITCDFDIVGHA